MSLPKEDIDALKDLELLDTLDEEQSAAACSLRDRWIDLLSDYRPPVLRHRLDAEGLCLIGSVEDALEEKLRASRHGMRCFLDDTEMRFSIIPTVLARLSMSMPWSWARRASRQPSVSMATLKNLTGIGDAGIAFETVIIDEAARVNPLDLFIPMSMAERRVILVGDHRQLPHLLEPNVESELAEIEDLTKEQSKALEESLFERLWVQLKDREAIDGFLRVVMLDTQFRMHPILGEFISKQFYESVGLSRRTRTTFPRSDQIFPDIKARSAPGLSSLSAWKRR